jgi:hypothetical protein
MSEAKGVEAAAEAEGSSLAKNSAQILEAVQQIRTQLEKLQFDHNESWKNFEPEQLAQILLQYGTAENLKQLCFSRLKDNYDFSVEEAKAKIYSVSVYKLTVVLYLPNGYYELIDLPLKRPSEMRKKEFEQYQALVSIIKLLQKGE